MGTRCLVRVYDERDNELCCIYRQFDGYPDGMGKDLAETLGSLRLVNGLSGHDPAQANGMGCLAATLVSKLKVQWEKTGWSKEIDALVPCTRPGNVYIYPPGTKDVWEEFEYHVKASNGGKERDGAEIILSCYDVDGHEEARKLVPLAEDVPAKDFLDACMKGLESRNLRVAGEHLHKRLKDFPWFLSVGVGANELIVMAKSEPAPGDDVPGEFDDFKVKVRVTGEITPLKEQS